MADPSPQTTAASRHHQHLLHHAASHTTTAEDPVLSPEDADLFQKMMTVEDSTAVAPTPPNPPAAAASMSADTTAGNRLPLEEHCVVLKSKTAPTKATRIWKEHVRFVFGKKKKLTDSEIQQLQELQDLYYRCTYGGDNSVTFWVEATASFDTTTSFPLDSCRYLGEVAHIPASQDCLRDEIKNNGVSAQQRRKRKKLKNPPTSHDHAAIATMNAVASSGGSKPTDMVAFVMTDPDQQEAGAVSTTAARGAHTLNKKFALTTLEKWKERVRAISQEWIQESVQWAERVVKRHLCGKLEEDLSKYATFWDQQCQGVASDDDYDQHRLKLHSAILLDTVNKLGNGMVDWYNQDYQSRVASSAQGGGGGSSSPGSSNPSSRGASPPGNGSGNFPNQNIFNSSPSPTEGGGGGGPTEDCFVSDEWTEGSYEEESESYSIWTEDSEDYYDEPSSTTSVTSILGDDSSVYHNGIGVSNVTRSASEYSDNTDHDSSFDADDEVLWTYMLADREAVFEKGENTVPLPVSPQSNIQERGKSMDSMDPADDPKFNGLSLDPEMFWPGYIWKPATSQESKYGEASLYWQRHEFKEKVLPSVSKGGLSKSVSKEKYKQSFFQMRLNSLRRIGWWLDKTYASRGMAPGFTFNDGADSDDETDGTEVEEDLDLFHPTADLILKSI